MALSTKFTIKNLCGLDDYSTWKFAIKMILIKEKLFAFTSKYPDSNNSTDIEKDQEALALICLHIEPTLYAYVQDSKHAKDAWDSLAKAFEDKGVNRRITLMNALLDEKLDNHSSMHQYVAAVMSLAQKLKDIATGFDDDLVAVVLLRGLPEEYRPMRMALEHSGMKLTSENVRQKLLQEDSRQGTSSSADSALAVNKSKKRIGNNDKLKCFKCGKKGHKKPDCPEGRIAGATSKSKDVVSLSSFSTGNSFDPSEWYIDSGASRHMSFNKHWFQNLVVNVEMNNVRCANDDKMECAGQGDIMVSMKGCMLAVRDVMYIPSLRVNLLSVSSNPRVIVRARDVVFLEDSTAAISENPSQLVNSDDKGAEVIWELSREAGQSSSQELSYTDEAEVYEDAEVESGETGNSGADNVVVDNVEVEETVDREESSEGACRYPLRNRIRDGNHPHGLACCTENAEPLTVKEALRRNDKDNWKEAMKKEMDSMYENKVWKLVDKPPGAKIVGNKWIFKYKFDADGNKTYKARLVAKGFTQSYGVDYFETYSPVVRRSTVRLLLSLAVEKDLFISHFDVNTAFLNGDLHERVYMRQPEGCIDENSKEKVCLLEKAIYGLKQASRSWNEKVNEVLLSLNFKRCDFDNCLYKNNNFYIALYVDDFLLFYKDKRQKEVLLDNLRKHFSIKDLGEARQVLGMLLSRTPTGISMVIG
ncbi:hypothetical protein B5X24_HaOG208365 [Helicoverpa armigera]|uniref:CCHC-type domain-containing protein n=1 Tax=Helicoverpa armigera TaxID=29058 RepID=A0A2W1BKD7_HELAM|nr:hypothetical protein B5X24_HaOG208365 [Helicoverpa armigera]